MAVQRTWELKPSKEGTRIGGKQLSSKTLTQAEIQQLKNRGYSSFFQEVKERPVVEPNKKEKLVPPVVEKSPKDSSKESKSRKDSQPVAETPQESQEPKEPQE